MLSQQEQIEKRLEDMPETCRGHYRKAMKGRSMKAAITAFCLECVGYVRSEVDICTDIGCPLYPFRPFQAIPWKARKVKAGSGGFRVKAASDVSQSASA